MSLKRGEVVAWLGRGNSGRFHFPQILSSSLKAGHAKDEANGMLPEINKGERGYSQSGKKVPSVSWCGVDLSCADALMTTEFVHELVCGDD